MQNLAPPAIRPIRRRRLWIWFGRPAVVLVGSYIGIIIVLLLLENRFVFQGVSARERWIAPPSERFQDIELTSADGTRIHAWWYPHPTSRQALVYCHGNAGNLSQRGAAVVTWQEQLGVSVLVFDYPGYGKSGGSPTEQGCYAAVDAAYQWLRTEQPSAGKPAIAGEDILLYGGSLGGGVAVDLASRQPHRALILCKTFTSIPELAQSLYFFLPARWLVQNQFNNLAKIKSCRQPVFIAHGCQDDLIPYSHGQRLFEAANEPKHFLTMDGCGHDGGVSDDFFPALRTFLQQIDSPRTTEQPAN